MKEVHSICKVLALLMLVSLVVLISDTAQAQGCYSTTNGYGPYYTNIAPGCGAQTYYPPSSSYSYFIATANTSYTITVSPGGGWAGCYTTVYNYNGSAWVPLFDYTTAGTYTFVITAADVANSTEILIGNYTTAGCPPTWTATSAVLTYQVTPPTAASVGGAQNLCGTLTSNALGGNGPAVGTGTWTQTSGPGGTTFNSGSGSPNTTGTATAYGTDQYTWTINNGGCTSAANTSVTYTASPTATPGGTTSATVCASSNSYPISGYSAANGGISWSTSGQGSFNNNALANPVYTFGGSDLTGGTVILTMTVNGTGACSGLHPTTTFALTIEPTPTASGGGSVTVCGSVGSYQIPNGDFSSSAPGVGTISWTTNGGGLITGGGGTLTPTYTFGGADLTSGGLVTLTMHVTGTAPCAVATAQFFLTIDAVPAASVGGPTTATVCSSNNGNGSYTIPVGYGATPASATISWASSGTGTFSNGGTTTPTYHFSPADMLGGTFTLTMTVSDGGVCPSSSATFSLTIDPAPVATPGPTTSEQVCITDGQDQVPPGYSATNGSILWSTTNGTGAFIAGVNTPTPTYYFGGSDIGPITLVMTVTGAAVCPAATANFIMIIDNVPVANPGATSSANVCGDANSYIIPAGYSAQYGTISWDTTGGGGDGTFTNGNSLTPTYHFGPTDDTIGGTITLFMNVTNAGCGTQFTTFTLNINPAYATPGPTTSATACASADNYTVTGYTAGNGTISWASTGTGTFTNGTTVSPTYNFSQNDSINGGPITLTMTVTSNNPITCTPTASFLLTIDPTPSATAGPTTTAEVCASVLSYQVPAGYGETNGTISWSTSGNGTFTNGTTLTPIYNFGTNDTATGGPITLTMTVTGGVACPPPTAAFVLTIDPIPAAAVGTTTTARVCATTGAYTIPAGYSSDHGAISWATSGDGTFTSGATTLTPTYTFGINDTATGGPITLTMTVTGPGVCPPATAAFTLTIDPEPEARAGSPASAEVCASIGSYTIPAFTSANGTISWSTTGTGTFTGGTTVSPTYNFSANEITNGGTFTLTMSVVNTTCAPVTAAFVLTIDQVPTTAIPGPTQNICASLISAPLGSNTPTIGTGLWTQTSALGTTIFSNSSDPASTATASVYDTYIYTWTISNGVCTPSTANTTVNFWDNPTTATTGPDQSVCGLTSASLGGNVPTVGTGAWSQNFGPGISTYSNSTDPAATATVSVSGMYIYAWTISNGNCATSTAYILVQYYDSTTRATTGSPQSFCGLASNSLGGNTPTVGTGAWAQVSGPTTATFSNNTDPSSTATVTDTGIYVYSWTITGSSYCPNTVAYDTVHYYGDPTPATAGPAQSLCGLTSTSLGANTPTVGTGTWSQFSGPGTTTFSNSGDPLATATASAPGTYVYTWTISNGACTPSTANDTVTLFGFATPATVGPNQSICGLASTTLGGNTPTTGTGMWAQASGPGTTTFSDSSNPAATATATAFGTYIYTWTISDTFCPSSTSANDTVIYYDNPTLATVGPDQNVCGLTSTALGGNTPVVGTGVWSQASGTGTTTFSNDSAGTSTATATLQGAYVYTWTIYSGACTSSAANINVAYSDTPTVATVGPNQGICVPLITTPLISGPLGGNTPTYGTGTWTQTYTSGTGTTTFSNSLDPAATATASDTGTYVYTWTISNGPCVSSTANDTVSYYLTPTTSTAGPMQNICASLISAPLGGNTPTVGTGVWTQTYTNGPGTTSFSSVNSGSSTATASDTGTYVYTWTITNGSCPPSTAYDTVNFYQVPTTATIAAPDGACSLTSDPLSGNIPTVGTGVWTQLSGQTVATFSNVNLGSSTATVTDTGTYVYTWTITNGTCPSSAANETVNYYQIPTTATVGPNQNICAGLTSASLGGNAPTVGTGSWSQTSAPPFGVTGFSNSFDSLSTATASTWGQYVYSWTITNGTCPASIANDTVNYYETPTTATAGPMQNICSSLISAPLGGNTPTIGTAVWTQTYTDGTGTTTFSNDSSGSTIATASDTGIYIYTWTITNGSCPPSTANDTINYYQPPTTATAGPMQNICASLISAPLGGNAPTVGTGVWTQTYTNGTGTTTFSNSLDPAATATASDTGTYIYTWTITNGSCPSSMATDTVNYYQVPTTATAGPMQNICASLISASLGGNAATVGTGVWTQIYTNGTGTTTFSNSLDSLAIATASDTGTYIYTWTITNGTCPSSTANDTVNYYQPPTMATAGPMQNLCSSLISAPLGGNAPTVGTGVWTQTSGTGTTTFSNSFDSLAIATASDTGTYIYTWTITNGSCPSSTANDTVNYYWPPTTATAGPMQSICASLISASLGGNAPTVGTGVWTQTYTNGTGTTTFSNSLDSLAIATASDTGTYIYTWTITNGTCPTSSANDTVNYYATPTTATVGATQTDCGLTSNSLGGNAPGIGTGVWTLASEPVTGTSTFSNASDPLTTATVSVEGTYVYTWTITNGTCPPSTANDTVTYYAIPTTATVGPTQDICGILTSNSLGGNTPVIGTGAWSQTSGPGTTIFSSNNIGQSTALASVNGTYVYTWTISNGVCTPSTASITVNYILSPSGGSMSHASYCSSTGTDIMSVTGVTNANQYQWSLPAGLSGSSMSSGITLTGTTPGAYTVTVTPEDMGFATACPGPPVTGTLTIFAMPVISSVNPGTLPCYGINNDTILINATTANGHLSYSIDSGVSYAYITNMFPNLGPGTYNITVMDDSSCTTAYTGNPVILSSPPQILVSVTALDNVLCYGAATGDITISVAGGSPGYSYLWSNADVTPSISGLTAGTYTVTVTDTHDCTALEMVTISQSSPLLLNAEASNVLCPPLQNGRITLPVSGGRPPYTFNWSNGYATSGIYGLPIGTYSATVTDSVGCVIDTTFVLINDSAIYIQVVPDTATINEGDIVQLGINAISNGAGNLHYRWTPVAGLNCTDCPDPGAGPTRTTTYTVEAISDSGCVYYSGATITVNTEHQLYVPNAFSPNADGYNDYWEIYGYKKAWVYCKVQIFDRWGEKIFESHDIDFKWDGTYRGTPVVIGVYIYQLTVVFADGYSTSSDGTITLLK
jgi:gliding motility-associated-like protein